MLPRQYRLPATIRLNNPLTHSTPYFVVKCVPNELSYSRFGFVIGKAIAKDAVHRNRAKRVLRSCIEERLTLIRGGYDMLFLLKKGIIGAEREVLSKEIQRFLSEKDLLR